MPIVEWREAARADLLAIVDYILDINRPWWTSSLSKPALILMLRHGPLVE